MNKKNKVLTVFSLVIMVSVIFYPKSVKCEDIWEVNGNFGIGTTAPTCKLDVNGTVKANSLIVDEGSIIGKNHPLKIEQTGYNQVHHLFVGGYSPNNPANRQMNMAFIYNQTGAKQYLFFKGTLGNASTYDNPKLSSSYTNVFGFEASASRFHILTQSAGQNTTPNRVFTVAPNGNIGIGCNPKETLDINGSIRMDRNNNKKAKFDFGAFSYLESRNVNGDNVNGGRYGTAILRNAYIEDHKTNTYKNPNGYLRSQRIEMRNGQWFFDIRIPNGTSETWNEDQWQSAFNIDGKKGNIGLGTNVPECILDIQKNKDPVLRITGKEQNDTAAIQLLENKADPYFGFDIKYNGDHNRFEINRYDASPTIQNALSILRSNGNVGIGTVNPANTLEVKGTVKASDLRLEGDIVIPRHSVQRRKIDFGAFSYLESRNQKADNTNAGHYGTALLRNAYIEDHTTNTYRNPNGYLRAQRIEMRGGQWFFDVRKSNGQSETWNESDWTSQLFIDGTKNRVGIGTVTPVSAMDVKGTVTATAFSGDGSKLSGVNVDKLKVSLNGEDEPCVIYRDLRGGYLSKPALTIPAYNNNYQYRAFNIQPIHSEGSDNVRHALVSNGYLNWSNGNLNFVHSAYQHGAGLYWKGDGITHIITGAEPGGGHPNKETGIKYLASFKRDVMELNGNLNIQKNTDPVLRITGKDSNDTAAIQLLEYKTTPYFGFEIKYDGDHNRFEINRYNSSPTVNNALSILRSNGNIGVGTADPQERLDVAGNIIANKYFNRTDIWADFVFEPGYNLMPIPKLKSFVRKNKHLPGIPTEKEVKKGGVDMGGMQVKLLQKVEELTLYVIELEGRVSALENK